MRLDLHIHSSYSRDGTASPTEILRRCKKIGLDGCAIADHNQIKGTLEAAGVARAENLLAIRAIEVSTAEGHVLAYGVADIVPRGLSVPETIDLINKAGGLAVAAHPVRFPSGIGLELAEECRFDAIEVLNGGSSSRGNRKAMKLADAKRSSTTAGSDAHELQEIGKAYVEVEDVSSEDDLLEAVRKGFTRPAGRSRSVPEGIEYSIETLFEWMRGSFKRI